MIWNDKFTEINVLVSEIMSILLDASQWVEIDKYCKPFIFSEPLILADLALLD